MKILLLEGGNIFKVEKVRILEGNLIVALGGLHEHSRIFNVKEIALVGDSDVNSGYLSLDRDVSGVNDFNCG